MYIDSLEDVISIVRDYHRINKAIDSIESKSTYPTISVDVNGIAFILKSGDDIQTVKEVFLRKRYDLMQDLLQLGVYFRETKNDDIS
jgi:hypothetical protein